MIAIRRLLRRAPVGAAMLATLPALLAAQAPAYQHTAPTPRAVPTTGATRDVTILHVADLHAALDVHPEIFVDSAGRPTFRPAGGFPLMAAALKAERAAAPGRTLVVNVGDAIHGSGVAEWTKGAAVVPLLNALGIDAYVPGNWEFAYGPEVFRQRMRELNHPVLGINLFDAGTGQRLLAPSVVKMVNGVRVGVVGITSVIVDKNMAPAFSKGLRFTLREGVQAEVDRLRKDGVEIVLLATELGLAQESRIAREIRGVDMILGGHTHERTATPITDGGTPVIQSGSEGSFLGRVTFRVRDGRVVGMQHALLEVTPERYAPDTAMRRLVAEAEAPFRDRLATVVGRTTTPLFRKGVLESTADNLIADAVREATGADIAIANGFRFSYPVLPGPVTEEDLFNLFPMDAHIKIGVLTGKQLRAFWEQSLDEVFAADAFGQRGGWGARPSGMAVRARLGAPSGQRVVALTVNGAPVRDDARYVVASCDREGDPAESLCKMPDAANTQTLTITLHDAMRAYFRRHGVIGPKVEGRVSAEDANGRAWSQYELGRTAPARP
ncbi:MAG: bifunctional metallophosphatase/5'-nucleotidase [Gemmatirosa sp.]